MQPVPKFAVYAILIILFCAGCTEKKTHKEHASDGKIRIITTLFPLYDYARSIAGDKGKVTLLLPPGMEPHGFEPKPDDIIRISESDLFIYANRYMEPWAETIVKGVDRGKLRIVDAGQGAAYQRIVVDNHGSQGHLDTSMEKIKPKLEDHDHAGGLDPHIWLDFGNAALIVDNILTGFIAADPSNSAYYRSNAATLKARLADLDTHYRNGLSTCGTRVFLHGGHYTFGYLARRYGLEYHALSGISSESEPSAIRMAAMVKQIRQSGVHYLFAEELLSPRLTETLASETGVSVLKLHGAHNLGRDDFQRGATFIGLMEENLKVLQKGLACRTK